MISHSQPRRLVGIVTGLALAAVAGASGALAQSAKLVAGTLTCNGEGGVAFIVGSTEKLACSYQPASGAGSQRYSASINRIGLDIGIKGPTVLVWTVLGSTVDLPSGGLAGSYAGVSADAAVGVGGGANALVGGSQSSVVLQPLSVQGQQGLNVAVGVAGLTLRHLR